jgi:Fe-S-cluster containining protein
MDQKLTDLIVEQKPQFADSEVEGRPALERNLKSQTWATFPVLAQNDKQACAALDAQGRCGIYPHWPMSCARFPFSLSNDLKVIFYSARCQSLTRSAEPDPRWYPMLNATVDSYNQRIRDFILLEYARPELESLGIAEFLTLQ